MGITITDHVDSCIVKTLGLKLNAIVDSVKTGIKINCLQEVLCMKGKKLTLKERNEKLERDQNERRKIFKELCAHVERGYSLDCFGEMSVFTIKKYLKTYPEEFCEEELEEAVRKGKGHWEEIGYRQANGACLGNSRTWYYNMVNRYGWHEKSQIETEHKGQVNVNVVSYASQKASQPIKKDE